MAGMQFVVPQFIEVESKIIGPISARQFVEILVTLGFMYVWFRLFPPFVFIPSILITGLIGGALAFGKVNGQLMHYFILNLIQTLRRPRLKIWERTEYVIRKPKKEKKKKEQLAFSQKTPVTESRLAEMSLMVDTGGTYASDEARLPGASTSVFDSAPNNAQQTQVAAPAPTAAAPDTRAGRRAALRQREESGNSINLGR